MVRHHNERVPVRNMHEGTKKELLGGLLQHRAMVVTALAGIILLGLALTQPDRFDPGPPHNGPTALILDQLASTNPNHTFVDKVTNVLNNSGYYVDYVSGGDLDVNYYKQLPRLGYDILILRTHSTATHIQGQGDDVFLFTNEKYKNSKHFEDQSKGLLTRVIYDGDDPTIIENSYFGIRAQLIEQVKGDFNGAVVFQMGCKGLANSSMSDVFLKKGASAYVGWDSFVGADRTDSATVYALESWLEEGLDISKAVQDAMEFVGEDPVYESRFGLQAA